jgi:endonuclease/exonuclease/phosphatase family metal-dependent hydrolase
VCWAGTTDQDLDEREEELKAIATWLADWAKDLKSWGHNLLTMGDFNIDQMGKRLHKAFTSTGLFIHEDFMVANAPRTYSKKPTFYDQIAWFVKDSSPQLSLEFKAGGSFDFTGHVLNNRNLSKSQLRYRISDHFPLWAEFLL